MSHHPRNVPAPDPQPGETPPRWNPRMRLLNKARDETGLYEGQPLTVTQFLMSLIPSPND